MLKEIEITELNTFRNNEEMLRFALKVVNEGGFDQERDIDVLKNERFYGDSYYIYDDEKNIIYGAEEYLKNILSHINK